MSGTILFAFTMCAAAQICYTSLFHIYGIYLYSALETNTLIQTVIFTIVHGIETLTKLQYYYFAFISHIVHFLHNILPLFNNLHAFIAHLQLLPDIRNSPRKFATLCSHFWHFHNSHYNYTTVARLTQHSHDSCFTFALTLHKCCHTNSTLHTIHCTTFIHYTLHTGTFLH